MDNGLSDDKFKLLRQMLPGMAEKLAERQRQKSGSKVIIPPGALVPKPTKFCQVCGKLFDMAMVPKDKYPEQGTCKSCQAALYEGYTAFVEDTMVGRRYAIARHPTLADMAGKIIPVYPATMTALEDRGIVLRQQENQDDRPPKTDS